MLMYIIDGQKRGIIMSFSSDGGKFMLPSYWIGGKGEILYSMHAGEWDKPSQSFLDVHPPEWKSSAQGTGWYSLY